MRIALGVDHRGYECKKKIVDLLKGLGHSVQDCGTDGAEPVDYPDHGLAAARAVSDGECERAILICGTGIGMCMVANKINGVRAASCNDLFSAEMSRKHNNANVLCVGADVESKSPIEERIKLWLDTPFEAEERHVRRVGKVMALDNGNAARDGDNR